MSVLAAAARPCPVSGSAPLRLLFVAPYVPSPIRVRSYQLIRHLLQQGHRVTVLALEDEFADAEASAEMEALGASVQVVPHPRWRAALHAMSALPTPTPLWAAYCRSAEMTRRLTQLSSSGAFDLAHVEHLRAAHFVSALSGLPTVFDAVDCIAALQRQLAQRAGWRTKLLAWEEWVKLRGYEPRAYRAFDRIAVTSAYDAAELKRLESDLPPIRVVPNGVDLEYFQPGGAPEPDTLVFSGKMSYRANDDAARFLAAEILPRLRRRRPGARLLIAGSSPSAGLQALAARDPGIEVTGHVTDLRPFLARARVAVCPMRIGVGIQNKALEAMAMGRPVVCTPIAGRALAGAERLGALRVAEDAEGFAAACAALLERPEAAERAGQEARRYVEGQHRWEDAAHSFVELYRAALASKR